MRGPAVRPVVIAAGGTGGHFFPAEALAEQLVARGHWVVLLTDARSGGLHSPVFAGRERFVLAGAGMAGRGVLSALRGGAGMLAGTAQARRVLRAMNAAAVVGFGGYPSVAPVAAARLMRHRPAIVLHEQNAVLGRANRLLARFADVLALTFSTTTRLPAGARAVVTGNPVRPAMAALADQGFAPPDDEVRLLVLGGSLGARVLSDVVPAAVALLPADLRSRVRVTQQCRSEDLPRVRAAYAACGVPADLARFFDDVAGRLAQAHLVIARAGASTIAELAVAGRPALLIPLPSAIDDHQTENARALVDAGGAWMLSQHDATADGLATWLGAILRAPDRLRAAAAAAAALGRPDAANTLADLVERTLAERVA